MLERAERHVLDEVAVAKEPMSSDSQPLANSRLVRIDGNAELLERLQGGNGQRSLAPGCQGRKLGHGRRRAFEDTTRNVKDSKVVEVARVRDVSMNIRKEGEMPPQRARGSDKALDFGEGYLREEGERCPRACGRPCRARSQVGRASKTCCPERRCRFERNGHESKRRSHEGDEARIALVASTAKRVRRHSVRVLRAHMMLQRCSSREMTRWQLRPPGFLRSDAARALDHGDRS